GRFSKQSPFGGLPSGFLLAGMEYALFTWPQPTGLICLQIDNTDGALYQGCPRFSFVRIGRNVELCSEHLHSLLRGLNAKRPCRTIGWGRYFEITFPVQLDHPF